MISIILLSYFLSSSIIGEDVEFPVSFSSLGCDQPRCIVTYNRFIIISIGLCHFLTTFLQERREDRRLLRYSVPPQKHQDVRSPGRKREEPTLCVFQPGEPRPLCPARPRISQELLQPLDELQAVFSTLIGRGMSMLGFY